MLRSVFFFTFVSFIYTASALYEDQIGKFDWLRKFLGRVDFAFLDPETSKRIVVGSSGNTVASLSTRNGEVVWRQVMEEDIALSAVMVDSGGDVITISGSILRVWDGSRGVLLWTQVLGAGTGSQRMSYLNRSLKTLVILVAVVGSGFQLTTIDLENREMSEGNRDISAPWITDSASQCLVSGHFVCCTAGEDLLYTLDLDAPSRTFQVQKLTGKTNVIKSLGGHWILLNGQIFDLFSKKTISDVVFVSGTIVPTIGELNEVLAVLLSLDGSVVTVQLSNDNPPIVGRAFKLQPPWDGAEILAASMSPLRKDQTRLVRVVVRRADDSLSAVQSPNEGFEGFPLWVREEALGNCVGSAILDLPMSPREVAVEEEFQGGAGPLTMFLRRLKNHYYEVVSLLFKTSGGGAPPTEASPTGATALVRDEFNVRKLILLTTRVGKMFALDSADGSILWSRQLPNMHPLGEVGLPIFVLRSTSFYPHPPLVVVVGECGGRGCLVSLGPVSGEILDEKVLPRRILWAASLPQVSSTHLTPVAILDTDKQLHVFPSLEGTEVLNEILVEKQNPFYVYLWSGNILKGFVLPPRRDTVRTSPIPPSEFRDMWSVRLSPDEQPLCLKSLDPRERVHSQGRVLVDRSVLYKYLNPNVIAIMTQSSKGHFSVSLVDAITGRILSNVEHRRARPGGCNQLVLAENWLVYSYFNEKLRRVEVASMELFEGQTQYNSSHFSSLFHSPHPIMVEQQAYIFPSGIRTLAPTVTEKGITARHLLIGLPSGHILELPRMFVDPRRPLHQMREEALIPYMPELPIPTEALINYNKTVSRVHSILCGPAALESTSVVLVLGLDLYWTRVMPSRPFDILKDDFDHLLILAALAALALGSYMGKKVASRKSLTEAWK